jgi:hypothetical protein
VVSLEQSLNLPKRMRILDATSDTSSIHRGLSTNRSSFDDFRSGRQGRKHMEQSKGEASSLDLAIFLPVLSGTCQLVILLMATK